MKYPAGIAAVDLKDAYLNVMEDLHVEVDDEFKSLLEDIDTPRDLLDVEKELLKIICDDKSGTITEVLAEDGKLASVDTVHSSESQPVRSSFLI
ncbi:hypothetical protein YC2023_018777 [Brassica napus]